MVLLLNNYHPELVCKAVIRLRNWSATCKKTVRLTPAVLLKNVCFLHVSSTVSPTF
jgi:hypothetical protein